MGERTVTDDGPVIWFDSNDMGSKVIVNHTVDGVAKQTVGRLILVSDGVFALENSHGQGEAVYIRDEDVIEVLEQ